MNFEAGVWDNQSFESPGEKPCGAGVGGWNQAIIDGFRLAFTQVTEDIIEINAAGRKAGWIKSCEQGGRTAPVSRQGDPGKDHIEGWRAGAGLAEEQ